MHISHLAGLAAVLGPAVAHPGHDVAQEAAERRSFLDSIKTRSLSHCLKRFAENGVEARNVARRAALVEQHRKKRGLTGVQKRDVDDVLNTNHNKTELGFTPNTPPEELFAGINACILSPEVTQGPYYVGGELIRQDVTEEQAGVDIILDYQVVDINTCEPIPELYLEIWHCNSTGVYSGVNANGNGNGDESNIDTTFLRGIQPTDADGVAQFESLFPGHYTGRTPHIHVMAHTNVTIYDNKTLGNTDIYASHIGQAFFDQALITEVELNEPYTSNTQPLTLNEDDFILAQEAATDGSDPLMQYTLLGETVAEGLFAWLAFGVDASISNHIEPAVFHYEDGSVENPNGGGGPGGPGGPPPA